MSSGSPPRLTPFIPSFELSLALLMAALLGLLGFKLFGPSGELVTVERKTWRLEIDVERRLEELSSGWCEEMPADAVELSRRLLPDPKRPEQSDRPHCRYRAPAWRTSWRALNQGALPQTPQWPQPPLRVDAVGWTSTQVPLGVERLGQRFETYELELAHSDGQTWTCRVPRPRWDALPQGLRFRLPVDRFGVANCAGLVR
ncbi:hypothetical protein [Roseateles sp.]|uniref:hypothetical protein n=1 Tax=Roseateles sp. TaxID=1971397 RepID=UPI003BA635B8